MIGKVISTLLKANASLLALVDTGSIFPYVINEDTDTPAIVYSVDSITPEYTKDGWTGDVNTFSVISIENDYASLQAIVTQVRAALEWKTGTTENVVYWNIMMTSQEEAYNIATDVFVNKLTFEVQVISYT